MNGTAVVVGGGLAGLTAAARLAHQGLRVTLLEKAAKLGGRAITIPMQGFNFNFGAHAIYGRDRSALRRLEAEVGLRVAWHDADLHRARYDLGGEPEPQLTPMPANLGGLYGTKILGLGGKVRFAYDIVKTVTALERGEDGVPIGEYLHKESPEVREMLLTVASSNFFSDEPERIPSPLFFEYYKRLFTTGKPVAYISGGWQSIVEGLEQIIRNHGGQIVTKAFVKGVDLHGGRVTRIHTRDASHPADHVVFCIPPSELKTLFASTALEGLFDEYAAQQPDRVVVYDIALKTRIEAPNTYIYHRPSRVFVTDISHYDPTCVPEGAQLLQGIAYLNETERLENRIDAELAAIEAVYDRHFAGWRDLLVTKRISRQAVVQEIKCVDDQRLMPVKFYALQNTFFAGDWCQGEGQLSELSFSSAFAATDRVMRNHRSGRIPVGVSQNSEAVVVAG